VSPKSRLLCALTFAAFLAVPATSLAGGGSGDAPEAGAVTVTTAGETTADVAATLTLGDGAAAYRFEYGTTAALDSRTAVAVATHDADDAAHRVTVTGALTGLAPGTTYRVRLLAAGTGGSDASPLTSFTTAAPAAPAPPPPGDAPPPPPPAAGPAPAPTAPPALGTAFVAGTEAGQVRVRLPGTDRFVDLAAQATLPVGSVVDARAGTIALTTALPGGGTQQGSFRGARFQVRQRAAGNGRTHLHLRGGNFSACGARSLASLTAGDRPRKAVRRLWGKDRGGRFRTHGRDSVTTVRGTEWSVADRCDGTQTKVTEGAVDVRVRRTGRVVRLSAGERFFARHRR